MLVQNCIKRLFSVCILSVAAASNAAPSEPADLKRRQSLNQGRFNLDDAVKTCTGAQLYHIRRAITDAKLLTDAVQGFDVNDPSFVAYFGTGWVGNKYSSQFFDLGINLGTAATMFDPNSPLPQSARIECVRACREPGPVMTTYNPPGGVPLIAVCPAAFKTHDGGVPTLAHIGDLVNGPPTTDLGSLRSFEQTLLHEVMHLDNLGYITPFDSRDVRFFKAPTQNANHIGDIEAIVSGLPSTRPDGKRDIYGPAACKQFARVRSQAHKPPNALLANADSYSHFAASRFFSQKLGRTVFRRDDPEDEVKGTSIDPFDIMDDPDTACAAISQPLSDDCDNISIVSNSDSVDFGSTCFTLGNRKWCGVYTSDTCQVSVGWDMTVSGEFGPSFANSDLAAAVTSANITGTLCSPYYQEVDSVCATNDPSVCSQAYVVCLKAFGQDCRPGANPDGVTRGPHTFDTEAYPADENAFIFAITDPAASGNLPRDLAFKAELRNYH
ncbi:hypothetical protein LTR15_003219 [Elasticomyces elasticus]|nr:hypothetical protein LTR15_003219 [Elasticomyces elasticus]